MELFINDKKNIPKNFVQFNRIKSLINSTYCDENLPMYIRIGKKRNCYRLSNLEIVQPINYDNVDKNSVTHLTDMGFSEVNTKLKESEQTQFVDIISQKLKSL